MIEDVKRTIRGCGYLPGYGHHPGTAFLLIIVIGAGLAAGSLWGSALAAFIFGPIYLAGAHHRAFLHGQEADKSG